MNTKFTIGYKVLFYIDSKPHGCDDPIFYLGTVKSFDARGNVGVEYVDRDDGDAVKYRVVDSWRCSCRKIHNLVDELVAL